MSETEKKRDYKRRIENVEQIDNKKALLIIGGIMLLIIGLYLMINGSSKLMENNTTTSNRITYNEKDDTYTLTIWEDENYTH